MKNGYLLFVLLAFAACNNGASSGAAAPDTSIVISNDTVPETRATVQKGPVAEYSERINDELNDWKFAVAIYETKQTFHFSMRIQCKEARVSDSLKIPNFGIHPKIEIHKGKEPLSCIIGFLDSKNQFKEYKKVSFKDEQLHVKTIQGYYVGAYRTRVK
ncbi:MAG: hypothetical protein V4450_10195 [Bacteroidota bacterium]